VLYPLSLLQWILPISAFQVIEIAGMRHSFLLFQNRLAILAPLHFPMNFGISFSTSIEIPVGILTEI
jgi:hypothetical protein